MTEIVATGTVNVAASLDPTALYTPTEPGVYAAAFKFTPDTGTGDIQFGWARGLGGLWCRDVYYGQQWNDWIQDDDLRLSTLLPMPCDGSGDMVLALQPYEGGTTIDGNCTIEWSVAKLGTFTVVDGGTLDVGPPYTGETVLWTSTDPGVYAGIFSFDTTGTGTGAYQFGWGTADSVNWAADSALGEIWDNYYQSNPSPTYNTLPPYMDHLGGQLTFKISDVGTPDVPCTLTWSVLQLEAL